MIGCASLPNSRYVGCEPSTKTYEGLVKLGEWLKEKNPTFDLEIHHKPYEEFQTDEKFDIALTSPPYYDTEEYSDEETNSLNKFKTFDEWVEGFFKPLVLKTMERMKEGACFILDIGDRRYPLSKIAKKICDENGYCFERVNDYLSGNGENKEKFYCISKKPVIQKQQELFLELD